MINIAILATKPRRGSRNGNPFTSEFYKKKRIKEDVKPTFIDEPYFGYNKNNYGTYNIPVWK